MKHSTGTYRDAMPFKVVYQVEECKPHMVLGVPEYVAWDAFMYWQMMVAAAAVYAPASWTADPVDALLLWGFAQCCAGMVALLGMCAASDS